MTVEVTLVALGMLAVKGAALFGIVYLGAHIASAQMKPRIIARAASPLMQSA
jgi:hypothetical protein